MGMEAVRRPNVDRAGWQALVVGIVVAFVTAVLMGLRALGKAEARRQSDFEQRLLDRITQQDLKIIANEKRICELEAENHALIHEKAVLMEANRLLTARVDCLERAAWQGGAPLAFEHDKPGMFPSPDARSVIEGEDEEGVL